MPLFNTIDRLYNILFQVGRGANGFGTLVQAAVIANLHAVMLPQMLPMMGSGHDHGPVDHAAVGLDVRHDVNIRLGFLPPVGGNLMQLPVNLDKPLSHGPHNPVIAVPPTLVGTLLTSTYKSPVSKST